MMRAKDEKVSVALPSRARLFLALLTRCLMALCFAGVTVVGGLSLVVVIWRDRAMVNALEIPLAFAVFASVGGLIFGLMAFGMQKATAVNVLPPPHLPEDDER